MHSVTNRRAPISSLSLLLPYMRPYLTRSLAAGFTLLLAAALVLALGQGLRRLIDMGFASGSMASLNRATLGMSVVIVLLAGATACRFYLVSWLGERVGADLRRDMFDRVISLSPAFFETARTGDILTRLTADISVLQALIGSAISQWLRGGILLLGALVMLLVTSPKLAGIVLLVVPLVLVPLILFGRRERRLSRAAQDRVADLGAYAEETINALRTVQAFTHEPVDRTRFAQEAERSVATALRRVRTRASLILAVILLGFGAIVFSLWVGGRDVIAGHMTGGDLSAFVFYAVLLASSGAQMSELWGELQRAGGAADRLREVLDERPSIADPASPLHLPAKAEGRVAFEDVVFHYPARPDSAALTGFSLAVAPGETIALVGPSGAGKTTVLQLLLRFYDPGSGNRAAGRGRYRAPELGRITRPDRHRAAGPGDLQHDGDGEYPLRPAGCERCRGARGGACGASGFSGCDAVRLRHVPGRKRRAAFGRPAPARGDRAGDPARSGIVAAG